MVNLRPNWKRITYGVIVFIKKKNNLVLMTLKRNSATLKDDDPFFVGYCDILYLINNTVTKAKT